MLIEPIEKTSALAGFAMTGLSLLKFFIFEALINLKRAGMMSFVTISTICVSLVVMGAFMLGTMGMEVFMTSLQKEAMVTAFITPGTPWSQVQAVQLKVQGFDEVDEIELISPRDALEELFATPADRELVNSVASLDEELLPATVRIGVRSSVDLPALLEKLKGMHEIDSVSYGEETFRQFQGLSDLLSMVSLLATVLLGLTSLFIVYNTVRLTLFMRRDEIIILKLVGATDWFIRCPFIVEGIVQGLIGATFATLLLVPGYSFVLARLAVLLPFFRFVIESGDLTRLIVKLFMMGTVLGVCGSLLSLTDLKGFCRKSGS